MANVLLIEDEFPARKLLEGYIQRTPDLVLAAAVADPVAGLARLREGGIDLLLLDINLPGLSGIELLRAQPERDRPPVILITAYADFAVDAFELGVADYLVKPVAFPRFLQAIQRALAPPATMTRVAPPTPNPIQPLADHVVVKAGGKTYRLLLADIRYIQGLRENVLFCTDQRQLIVHKSLRELEEALPPPHFLRCHKSYLVNLAHVHFRESMELVLHDGQRLPIGQTYKAEVDALF